MFIIKAIIRLLLLTCITYPHVGFSQIYEDFNDRTFSPEYNWNGDTSHFIQKQGTLTLHAPGAGSSWVYLPINVYDSLQWNLNIHMDFAPSSSNFCRFILCNTGTSVQNFSGFFLQFGESGNDDAIRLFYQDGTVENEMLSLSPSIGEKPVEVSIQVDYYASSETWIVKADYDLDGVFEDKKQVDEWPMPNGEIYAGIFCQYTATRTRAFSYDDLFIGPLRRDTTAPVLDSIHVVDQNHLRLVFSEIINASTGIVSDNYHLQPGSRRPDSVAPGINRNEIDLFFINPLQNNTHYNLHISNLVDLSGNAIEEIEMPFFLVVFMDPSQGDLVINEIYPDPDNQSPLPFAEYVEIYNAGQDVLKLNNVQFADKRSAVFLGTGTLSPGDYCLLIDQSDLGYFDQSLCLLPLSDLPALNNSGDNLKLIVHEDTIDQVNYDRTWYEMGSNYSSGFSLERRDPNSICSSMINWSVSQDIQRGTPGRLNSVSGLSLESPAPKIQYSKWLKPGEIVIRFNMEMDPVSTEETGNYWLDDFLIENVTNLHDANRLFKISVDGSADTGSIHRLYLDTAIETCTHVNIPPSYGHDVVLPNIPSEGALLINEVLFKPHSGGAEYIEMLNATRDEIFDIRGIEIKRRSTAGDEQVERLSHHFLMFPGDLVAITPDTNGVIEYYEVNNAQQLYENELPNLIDAGGDIELVYTTKREIRILDATSYSEDMHDPVLVDDRGTSLERLSPEFPSLDPSNWYSASSRSGGGTPASTNSQSVRVTDESAGDPFSLISPTFSPDSDNFEDLLIIRYELDNPGFRAQIRVFDTAGRCIRHLVNNESLGTSGIIRWSGDTDTGELASVDIYFVYIQLYANDGFVEEYIKTVVLAGK